MKMCEEKVGWAGGLGWGDGVRGDGDVTAPLGLH